MKLKAYLKSSAMPAVPLSLLLLGVPAFLSAEEQQPPEAFDPQARVIAERVENAVAICQFISLHGTSEAQAELATNLDGKTCEEVATRSAAQD